MSVAHEVVSLVGRWSDGQITIALCEVQAYAANTVEAHWEDPQPIRGRDRNDREDFRWHIS